jgi:hypothetical protein
MRGQEMSQPVIEQLPYRIAFILLPPPASKRPKTSEVPGARRTIFSGRIERLKTRASVRIDLAKIMTDRDHELRGRFASILSCAKIQRL